MQSSLVQGTGFFAARFGLSARRCGLFGMVLGLLMVGHSVQAVVPRVRPVYVVCTLPSLASVAQQVGGDRVRVQALAAPTEDPHFVEAKPNFILALNRADLLVAVGLDLEVGWLPTLLVSARNAKIQQGRPGYMEASSFVELLNVPSGGALNRIMGDIHAGGNPHFLSEPVAVARIASGIAQRLAELDPEHANDFAQRAQSMQKELMAFSEVEHARFAKLPATQRRLVTYHKSWDYVLKWLELSEVITLEPKPGIAPDPGHVANVLAMMRRDKLRAIVQEEYYPVSTSKTLSRLAHAQLVVLPGGVRFTKGQRYLDFFQEMTDKLYNALTAEQP